MFPALAEANDGDDDEGMDHVGSAAIGLTYMIGKKAFKKFNSPKKDSKQVHGKRDTNPIKNSKVNPSGLLKFGKIIGKGMLFIFFYWFLSFD